MRRRTTIGFLVVLLLAVLVPPAAGATVEEGRLAGRDRFETAVAIAAASTANGGLAYLARADAFPDALAAGTLTLGPIILVPSDGPPPQPVLDALDRLGVQEVVALGGPAAISDATLAAAAEGRTNSGRIFGADRFATAVAIAQRAFPDGAETVYLARADAFPDALAAGALTDGPILLVPSDGAPPEVVLDEIVRLHPKEVIALGGTAAVADATLAAAAQGRSRDRLAGADRFATAVAIARRAFPDGAGVLYLARADAFPDALAAGALTAGPVLLVPRDGAPPEEVLTFAAEARPLSVVALGGTAAVSDATRAAVAAAARSENDVTEPEGAVLVTTRPDGEPSSEPGFGPSLSADGRLVAFISSATDLGPPRRTDLPAIYVRDLATGEVHLASLDADGEDPRPNTAEESDNPGGSAAPSLSADGRFVAFTSDSATLVEDDTNRATDVFVRDLQEGTTVAVSVNTSGRPAAGSHFGPSISADGRYVAFESGGRDLVSEPTTGGNVFVRDLLSGTTVLASPGESGESGSSGSFGPSISGDGRLVSFATDDPDVVARQADRQARFAVVVRDLVAETTTLVSSYEGADRPAAGGELPRISADGSFIAFRPSYTNELAQQDQVHDLYVRDLRRATTVRVASPYSEFDAPVDYALSGDGRRLVFTEFTLDRSALVLADPVSGARTRIVDEEFSAEVEISADASAIAYYRDGDLIVAPRPMPQR